MPPERFALAVTCMMSLPLAWAELALAGDPPRRPDVVLTTDCGAEVDDQWALAHLALLPEISLKGVVTTHAPGFAEPAAESSRGVALEVLRRLPLSDRPPVLAGSSRPLADREHPRMNPGVQFLLDQARGHTADDRLVLLMIGAATDVASALLADPSVCDRIRIVAMGFDAWPGGTDPWNVKNDIKAWQVVLASKAPLVVGDAAVTKRHLLMTVPRARSLLGGQGPGAEQLVTYLERWLKDNGPLVRSITGRDDTWPIWDEVVTAHLLGMTRTETHPRPALRDDMTFDHSHPQGTVEWVTSIDSDRLWADLVARYAKARSAAR